MYGGVETHSQRWQGISVVEDSCDRSNPMIEVCNAFISMQMIEDKDRLAELCGADLPWAEDHFQERIAGFPTNPGEQYKNWPHWVVDPKFMEGEMFSHTYQERFWPPPIAGIRYNMGDLDDVVARLRSEPTTRQAFLSIWHPEDQDPFPANRRLPCTIGYWFKINQGRLDVTYLIRSCDARRHFRNDVYMTQRLAHHVQESLLSNNIDVQLGVLSIWVGSLHCFKSDIYSLEKQVK